MRDKLSKINQAVSEAGGQAFLVGGYVRDNLLNKVSKDVDIEVFGIEADKLKSVCQSLGKVSEAGESFSVLKLTMGRDTFDISLPRSEKKNGSGHKGFAISADPFMPKQNAAKRRDFTFNALMQNLASDEILDFFGGAQDIENKVIRHVDATTFVEDSLRVLRACQFAARFEFTIAPETIKLCKTINLLDLPQDRVKEELFKLLLKGKVPSLGLKAMRDTLVIDQLFPELLELPANQIIDRAVYVRDSAGFSSTEEKLVFMLTLFLSQLSIADASKILDRLGIFTVMRFDVRKQVLLQLEYLNYGLQIYNANRKVFNRLANTGVNAVIMEMLLRVDYPLVAEKFINNWTDYQLPLDGSKIKHILQGKHLIKLGMAPGVEMGKILAYVFQEQLDDKINTLDEALVYVKDKYGI